MGAILLGAVLLPTFADTPYPIEKDVARENRKKVESFKKDAYWSKAPFAVAAVNPLSGIRRAPDLFPEDGKFTEPLSVIAAQNEYEGASLLLYGFKDSKDVLLKANNLQGPGGAVLPAANVDIKIVKVWYQQGTAWGSFFSDALRRIPTPELMVYDEALLHVDHVTKENFLRRDTKNGTDYQWISFNAAAVDHSYEAGVKNEQIHDAETLQPFTVNENEFKQLILTYNIPAGQKPGLYKGTVDALVAGKKVCDIPVEVQVLPFALPEPKTFYNAEKPFMVTPYMGRISVLESEKLVRNMVRHNVRNCLLPAMKTTEIAKKAYAMFKKTGFDTENLFCALPGCGLTSDYPPKEDNVNYTKFVAATNDINASMEVIRQVFGKDVKAYSYGIDEGSAATVRRERATWQAVHRAGGNTIVATRWHPYILFNLDYANVPRHPRAYKKADADAFHASNPDGIIGWYADPHSGPENPDYTRRLYGWQTWRNNYDAICQYILFRDNWNDFWVPAEAFLRGLMLVYPQDNDILDTIEWEGLREGLDDVRYGTLLKSLCEKGRKSENVDTAYAARAALAWVSQVDCERSELEYLRLEMISRILDLQTRLAKEGK